MHIGLYGGTFDPIHKGHIYAAEQVLKACNVDEILFIPSAQPPHKLNKTITAFKHRYAMVNLAIETNSQFRLSDIEDQRGGRSYTIDTVTALHEQIPNSTFSLIMGNDMAGSFSTWYQWQRLLTLVSPIVLTRKGQKPTIDPNLDDEAKAIFSRGWLSVDTLAASSTEVRNRYREKAPVDDLLHDRVINYIKEHNLYV